MSPKHYGLLLVLGGAPDTPHIIEGLPGYYTPSVPHPVGDSHDLSLEDAKKVAKEKADVLRLVEIAPTKLEGTVEAHRALRAAGRNELVQAQRDGRAGDDSTRTKDERDAVKEA